MENSVFVFDAFPNLDILFIVLYFSLYRNLGLDIQFFAINTDDSGIKWIKKNYDRTIEA